MSYMTHNLGTEAELHPQSDWLDERRSRLLCIGISRVALQEVAAIDWTVLNCDGRCAQDSVKALEVCGQSPGLEDWGPSIREQCRCGKMESPLKPMRPIG